MMWVTLFQMDRKADDCYPVGALHMELGHEMTSRRSIAERVFARASARGTPIEHDLEFMAIVEQWIAGVIDADRMRDHYNDLLRQRSMLRKGEVGAVADRSAAKRNG